MKNFFFSLMFLLQSPDTQRCKAGGEDGLSLLSGYSEGPHGSVRGGHLPLHHQHAGQVGPAVREVHHVHSDHGGISGWYYRRFLLLRPPRGEKLKLKSEERKFDTVSYRTGGAGRVSSI